VFASAFDSATLLLPLHCSTAWHLARFPLLWMHMLLLNAQLIAIIHT
jgi:hypothetical protein